MTEVANGNINCGPPEDKYRYRVKEMAKRIHNIVAPLSMINNRYKCVEVVAWGTRINSQRTWQI